MADCKRSRVTSAPVNAAPDSTTIILLSSITTLQGRFLFIFLQGTPCRQYSQRKLTRKLYPGLKYFINQLPDFSEVAVQVCCCSTLKRFRYNIKLSN